MDRHSTPAWPTRSGVAAIRIRLPCTTSSTPRCSTAATRPAVCPASRSGGVGCFTADSFPVFDYMRPNVYVIADSNHGYKMIGVGREVAQVMTGGHSSILYPFRYERFATGDLHPVSNSPYPWS